MVQQLPTSKNVSDILKLAHFLVATFALIKIESFREKSGHVLKPSLDQYRSWLLTVVY